MEARDKRIVAQIASRRPLRAYERIDAATTYAALWLGCVGTAGAQRTFVVMRCLYFCEAIAAVPYFYFMRLSLGFLDNDNNLRDASTIEDRPAVSAYRFALLL